MAPSSFETRLARLEQRQIGDDRSFFIALWQRISDGLGEMPETARLMAQWNAARRAK